jgi:hypothetical protein
MNRIAMARLDLIVMARPLPVMAGTVPIVARTLTVIVARRCERVMTGLDPAISRGTVLDKMAESSPAKTKPRRAQ